MKLELSRLARSWHVVVLWTICSAALIVIVCWAYLDPDFVALVNSVIPRWAVASDCDVPLTLDRSLLGSRRVYLIVALAIAAISWLTMLMAALIGPVRSRGLQAWMMIMTLAAVWLFAGTNWIHIARLGKIHRLRASIDRFEALASPLRKAWPESDGQSNELGPFMAYPVGRPSVLMLLTMPLPSDDRPGISVVERGSQGQLRFQLAGRERGNWIEWHPEDSHPTSFVGGLLNVYVLKRADPICDQWFLTDYRNSPLGSDLPL